MSLRILHFSDIHLPFPAGSFRAPGILHPKRLVALVNFYLRRGSKYARALQKLNGLNDFLRREPVDYLLFTGDTLNFGLEREFTGAAPRLAETLGLARRGALAVPGNHDLYTQDSPACTAATLLRSSAATCPKPPPIRGSLSSDGWATRPSPSPSTPPAPISISGTPADASRQWNSMP